MPHHQRESLGIAERLRGLRAISASIFFSLALIATVPTQGTTSGGVPQPEVVSANAVDDIIDALRELLGLPPLDDPEDDDSNPDDGW